MKIIRESYLETETFKTHFFEEKNCPGAGYAFVCDNQGNIVITDGNRENVEKCQNGTYKVIDRGVQTEYSEYRMPTIGECECGKHVELSSFTNSCECGRDYNMSGQELAPRECWGEETGETLQEILSI